MPRPILRRRMGPPECPSRSPCRRSVIEMPMTTAHLTTLRGWAQTAARTPATCSTLGETPDWSAGWRGWSGWSRFIAPRTHRGSQTARVSTNRSDSKTSTTSRATVRETPAASRSRNPQERASTGSAETSAVPSRNSSSCEDHLANRQISAPTNPCCTLWIPRTPGEPLGHNWMGRLALICSMNWQR